MAFQPLDLESIFSFHPATPETGPAHEAVRETCLYTAINIRNLTPACPEQTLAIRALQEAMMWANSAIAQNGVPDEPEPKQSPKPALGHHGADG